MFSTGDPNLKLALLQIMSEKSVKKPDLVAIIIFNLGNVILAAILVKIVPNSFMTPSKKLPRNFSNYWNAPLKVYGERKKGSTSFIQIEKRTHLIILLDKKVMASSQASMV